MPSVPVGLPSRHHTLLKFFVKKTKCDSSYWKDSLNIVLLSLLFSLVWYGLARWYCFQHNGSKITFTYYVFSVIINFFTVLFPVWYGFKVLQTEDTHSHCSCTPHSLNTQLQASEIEDVFFSCCSDPLHCFFPLQHYEVKKRSITIATFLLFYICYCL